MSDTTTDYNGWTKPAEGKEGWHPDYYDLLNDLDVKVIVTGSLSDRPSDAPDDAWFYAEDEDTIYQFDGVDWRARLTDAETVGGYEIQVNGTDGEGIINLKTED